jgi:hypothetical protein
VVGGFGVLILVDDHDLFADFDMSLPAASMMVT